MLSFAACIWASDDTDPIERLAIQAGLSHFYPPSALSNHVSGSPHQATLRATPLSTRFNVASFGVLGYELNLTHLSGLELSEIREQIAFYKRHRRVLQWGRFTRRETSKGNKVHWQAGDGSLAVVGWFQTQARALEPFDRVSCVGLDDEAMYRIATKPQRLYLARFGELIRHALPVDPDPHGFAFSQLNKRKALDDAVETYTASGAMLRAGILLNQQFMGSHYHEDVRMLGDFGSSLYVVERIDEQTKGNTE